MDCAHKCEYLRTTLYNKTKKILSSKKGPNCLIYTLIQENTSQNVIMIYNSTFYILHSRGKGKRKNNYNIKNISIIYNIAFKSSKLFGHSYNI